MSYHVAVHLILDRHAGRGSRIVAGCVRVDVAIAMSCFKRPCALWITIGAWCPFCIIQDAKALNSTLSV